MTGDDNVDTNDLSKMTNKELLKIRAKLQAEADKVYERWEDLCEQISSIEEIFDERERQREDEQRDRDTKEYLQTILQINDSNSMHVRLLSDTATTPIMSKFYRSDKQFLIFDKFFYIYPENIASMQNKHYRLSLIISRSSNKLWCRDNGLTMTDLKKRSGAILSKQLLKNSRINTESRIYPLYDEIINIYDKVFTGENYIPFDCPCRLGGQTYANQTGFGNIYNGEDLIEEGTLYGETTEFLVLGVIVSSY